MNKTPTTLIIMDGFGLAPASDDNAVSLADLIMFQKYWRGALVFNEQQLVNANVEVSDAELNDQDTHALLQFLIGTIDALPV